MKPTNVKEFRAEITDYAKKVLPEKFLVFHQKIAMELLSRVVRRNPVDTGRSRNNWQAGLSTNETGVADWYTRSPGESVMELATRVKDMKPFAVIFLWNNVEYVLDLEDGTSRQAPDGFVAISIAELQTLVGT